MSAEYGSIPARLNGTAIADLADISVTEARNVVQNATTSGVRQTYGLGKYQAALTFKNLANKLAFMQAVGIGKLNPTPHNLGYTLGGAYNFSLNSGIPSNTQIQSDQDGTVSLQITCMYESYTDEN